MWFNRKNKEPKVIRPAARVIRAKFDAAQTNSDNIRHWANADGLSADAAANSEVRRILRNRARYEVANNSYARGIVSTLANDVVGTGPRLQMLAEDGKANRQTESAFSAWADEIRLAQKLRTMRMARAQDGEIFAVLAQNDNLESLVKLDLKLIEADQVTMPWSDLRLGAWGLGKNTNPRSQAPSPKPIIDGIEFDRFGNPAFYDVMRYHPGDAAMLVIDDFDRIPASAMIHWYRMDRPGQHRGIPEIMPALPLFAQLRRYTLAVIAAAETAADFAAVLYTDSPANGEAANLEPMDVVELEKRMATTLPDGWKLGQIEAQQPSTTYAEFKKEILNEIARCLNIPFNIAAGNSSGYNYASGRLDHQTYFKSIRVDQVDIALIVLDRVLNAWLGEAVLIEGFLPQSMRLATTRFDHQWFWDGHEHVDPAKEANAQAMRLQNHTTTLASEFAKLGLDWETELRQRAKEKKLMDELGLSESELVPTTTEHEDDREET